METKRPQKLIELLDWKLVFDEIDLKTYKDIKRRIEQGYGLEAFDIDCKVVDETEIGKSSSIRIDIENIGLVDIYDLECTLDVDPYAEITPRDPVKIINLKRDKKKRINWRFQPFILGSHNVSINMTYKAVSKELGEYDSEYEYTLAEPIAVKADIVPQLRLLTVDDRPITEVYSGNSFILQAQVENKEKKVVEGVTIVPILDSGLDCEETEPHILNLERGEKISTTCRIMASESGEKTIGFEIAGTGIQITTKINVLSSPLDFQKSTTERLEQRIAEIAQNQFGVAVPTFPIRVFFPEHYLSKLRELQILTAEELNTGLELLKNAREGTIKEADVDQLLFILAPLADPAEGVLLAYDPLLSKKLISKDFFKGREYRLSEILNPSEAQIAAVLSHEKYGHGFFYNTRLGQDLSELARERLLNFKKGEVPRPSISKVWLRPFYDKYKRILKSLFDSCLIPNEGFSLFMEMEIMKELGGEFLKYADRKKDWILNVKEDPDGRTKDSEYFDVTGYDPGFNPYKEGYDLFSIIYKRLNQRLCVVYSLMLAANIDIGLSRTGEVLNIAMSPEDLEIYLLEADEEILRCDWRLFDIKTIVWDNVETILDSLKNGCYKQCPVIGGNANCPIERLFLERE